MRIRRLAVVASLLAVTAVVPAATPASAGSPSTKVDATLEGSVTGGGAWCCGHFLDFQGSAVMMGAGTVAFTGSWLGGCSFPTLPTPCFRRLDLLLVARNGDQLALRGRNEWTLPSEPAPQATTWGVDQTNSTGRFADFSASGIYTFDEGVGSSTVTISLSGTRQPGRQDG
jgi:hypothetical protein